MSSKNTQQVLVRNLKRNVVHLIQFNTIDDLLNKISNNFAIPLAKVGVVFDGKELVNDTYPALLEKIKKHPSKNPITIFMWQRSDVLPATGGARKHSRKAVKKVSRKAVKKVSRKAAKKVSRKAAKKVSRKVSKK